MAQGQDEQLLDQLTVVIYVKEAVTEETINEALRLAYDKLDVVIKEMNLAMPEGVRAEVDHY